MADKVKMEGILEGGYGIVAKKAMKDRNLNVVSKAIYAYICSYAGKGCFSITKIIVRRFRNK